MRSGRACFATSAPSTPLSPRAGVTVLPVRAGWTACLRVPAVRSEEDLVLDLLESHDLLVQPGYFYEFPFEAFVVFSLLPPPDVFREALERLVRALTSHR